MSNVYREGGGTHTTQQPCIGGCKEYMCGWGRGEWGEEEWRVRYLGPWSYKSKYIDPYTDFILIHSRDITTHTHTHTHTHRKDNWFYTICTSIIHTHTYVNLR